MTEMEVIFSWEELEVRSALIGEPPILVLLRRPVAPKVLPPEKLPAIPLICVKLKEALEANPKFSGCEPFKIITKGRSRAHLKCQHDVKASITYLNESLQMNKPLNFTAQVKCGKCLGHTSSLVEVPSDAPVSVLSSVQVPSTSSAQLQLFTMSIAPSVVSPAFEVAGRKINEVHSKYFYLSSAADDPKQKLIDMKAQLVDELGVAWDNAIEEAFPGLDTPAAADGVDDRATDVNGNQVRGISDGQNQTQVMHNLFTQAAKRVNVQAQNLGNSKRAKNGN